jgi:hypothetical protein
MPKNLTIQQTYEKCIAEGNLLPQDKIDIHKIKSMLVIIEEYMKVSASIKNSYNVKYDTQYTIIHMLTEALLLFDRIKSLNHQCLFTCLCIQYPKLDLDWSFFEKIRTKRNGIHYYGTAINQQDWKEIALQMTHYTEILYQTLKNKMQQIERKK